MRCQQIEASGYATAMLADRGDEGLHLWISPASISTLLYLPRAVTGDRNQACIHNQLADWSLHKSLQLPPPVTASIGSCRWMRIGFVK